MSSSDTQAQQKYTKPRRQKDIVERKKWNWYQKAILLVTGASRGIGKAIAFRFAPQLGRDSLLIMAARNKNDLEENANEIKKIAPKIQVHFILLDFKKPDPQRFHEMITGSLKLHKCKAEDFAQAIIVHNVGTTGEIGTKTINMKHNEVIKDYMDLNLFTMISVNVGFFQVFSEAAVKERLVVHISSLAAIKPFMNWGFYCIGKAARDMYFRVLAVEEPTIRVLNYAPGPVNTELAQTALLALTGKEDFYDDYKELLEGGKFLTAEQSAHMLVEILTAGKFKSGDHLDFYDNKMLIPFDQS